MLIVAIVPLIVCIIGLLLYVFPGNAERKETGRLMFACGLLVTLFVMGAKTISIGGAG